MSENRLHVAIIMVGGKGTGKSTELAKLAAAYPKDRKVLICDVNGSPAYNAYQEIQPEAIPRLRSGIAKIYGVPTENTLEIIRKHFRDGMIIYEDCTSYIRSNPQASIRMFLADHRMMGCDLVFTFHGLSFIPPFFRFMCAYIIIKKTPEALEDVQALSKLPNKEAILEAFQRVSKHKDRYYSETVETFI